MTPRSGERKFMDSIAVRLAIGLCVCACSIGCGRNDYLVDSWVYAFFTDSVTIGAVRSQYIENHPNTGIGESWIDFSNFSCDIRTCDLYGGSEKVLMTADTGMGIQTTLLDQYTVCKLPLISFDVNFQPIILDLSTKQTVHSNNFPGSSPPGSAGTGLSISTPLLTLFYCMIQGTTLSRRAFLRAER